MMKKCLVGLLAIALAGGEASAQIGLGGIVYDPTNYQNALLRYYQLELQLAQLKQTYDQIVNQYNLALEMSRNLQNMAARYRALFSQWRMATAEDTYGNTAGWVEGINSGELALILAGYQQATTQLLSYDPAELAAMTAQELARVKSQYASVELADGANTTAMATIGAIRDSTQDIQVKMGNLEQDSLTNDPSLNTEVSVLNKINASEVLSLRTLQDSNKLLASLLEEQTIAAKQQRETTANSIDAEINRRATLATNLANVTATLTESIQNFRMP